MDHLLNAVARVEQRPCWRAELCSINASSTEACDPTFVPGLHHLKNKFCSVCRASHFDIDADRVRVLPASAPHANPTSQSPWSNGFRVVNQTKRCTGPRALLLQKGAPSDPLTRSTAVLPVPDEWVRRDNPVTGPYIRFVLLHGTLVPTAVTVEPTSTEADSSETVGSVGLQIRPEDLDEPSAKRACAEQHPSVPPSPPSTPLAQTFRGVDVPAPLIAILAILIADIPVSFYLERPYGVLAKYVWVAVISPRQWSKDYMSKGIRSLGTVVPLLCFIAADILISFYLQEPYGVLGRAIFFDDPLQWSRVCMSTLMEFAMGNFLQDRHGLYAPIGGLYLHLAGVPAIVYVLGISAHVCGSYISTGWLANPWLPSTSSGLQERLPLLPVPTAILHKPNLLSNARFGVAGILLCLAIVSGAAFMLPAFVAGWVAQFSLYAFLLVSLATFV